MSWLDKEQYSNKNQRLPSLRKKTYNSSMDSVDKAFREIHRADFLPEASRKYADIDAPLPIGFDQTNSQPSTVRQMLEWLDVEQGHKVLDIGSGSGWTTALLATIVGPNGQVFAVEKIPELLNFGRNNCERLTIKNTNFFQSKKVYGLPEYAPFDRILVSVAAQEIPNELLSQLKIDGKMVLPVKNDILVITKISSTEYEIIKKPGFIFVPLV